MDVLIVENDASLAETIREAIEAWGHNTETSTTGADTPEKARCKKFDLALIDVFLPDGKGHHLIPQLKELWPDIWIVTMTGHNTRDLELEVRKQRIAYYMIKPFEPEALKAILDQLSQKIEKRGKCE